MRWHGKPNVRCVTCGVLASHIWLTRPAHNNVTATDTTHWHRQGSIPWTNGNKGEHLSIWQPPLQCWWYVSNHSEMVYVQYRKYLKISHIFDSSLQSCLPDITTDPRYIIHYLTLKHISMWYIQNTTLHSFMAIWNPLVFHILFAVAVVTIRYALINP